MTVGAMRVVHGALYQTVALDQLTVKIMHEREKMAQKGQVLTSWIIALSIWEKVASRNSCHAKEEFK